MNYLKPKRKQFRRPSESYDESSASLLRRSSITPSDSSKYDEYPKNTKPPLPRPTLREVFTRQSVINLIAYTFLALHSVAFDQLLPIFLHHPPQVPNQDNTRLPFKFSGGFGLKSGRIGTIFTMYGVLGCVVQFLIFPPTARRFGVLNCFKGCALAFPLICFATPYTALIQRPMVQQAAMFGIMIVKCFAVIFAFPCSVILLTNSAVSLRILGTLERLRRLHFRSRQSHWTCHGRCSVHLGAGERVYHHAMVATRYHLRCRRHPNLVPGRNGRLQQIRLKRRRRRF